MTGYRNLESPRGLKACNFAVYKRTNVMQTLFCAKKQTYKCISYKSDVFKILITQYSLFLIADTRLYTLQCRSIGTLVRPFVIFLNCEWFFALLLLPYRPRLDCHVPHCVPNLPRTSEGTYMPKLKKPKTQNLILRLHV